MTVLLDRHNLFVRTVQVDENDLRTDINKAINIANNKVPTKLHCHNCAQYLRVKEYFLQWKFSK